MFFTLRNIGTFTICVGLRLDCNICFLFERQVFNGLLKVIGIKCFVSDFKL